MASDDTIIICKRQLVEISAVFCGRRRGDSRIAGHVSDRAGEVSDIGALRGIRAAIVESSVSRVEPQRDSSRKRIDGSRGGDDGRVGMWVTCQDIRQQDHHVSGSCVILPFS
jgi:hypothetical protein